MIYLKSWSSCLLVWPAFTSIVKLSTLTRAFMALAFPSIVKLSRTRITWMVKVLLYYYYAFIDYISCLIVDVHTPYVLSV